MITPSIYLKLLWEKDNDYKFYTEQALSNFHDTYKLPMSSVKPGESQKVILVPNDLKKFYESQNINFKNFTEYQRESLKDWGITEDDIEQEIDRQELDLTPSDEESCPITLLFAMKWFNSDLTNRGYSSNLVKHLLI